MFVGHFGIANAAAALLPRVPPLVIYAGVSFPDLLWSLLVLAGIERVRIDPASPRQTHTVFEYFPYSHSLVLTTLLALLPALGITFWTHFLLAGLVFVLASSSHWVLDILVHHRDLPILGFGKDRKIGLGGWDHPLRAFVGEYLVYSLPTLLFVKHAATGLLLTGLFFHLVNANAFFGWTKRNPFPNSRVYAAATLLGFAALAWTLHFRV